MLGPDRSDDAQRISPWIKALAVISILVVYLVFVLPEDDDSEIPSKWVLPASVDAWSAGRAAYDAGSMEEAVAYWRQVPSGHREYARALRYIGWEVYADELGEPRRGLSYVHRSVLEEPLASNTWQDLGRTYASMFSLPIIAELTD